MKIALRSVSIGVNGAYSASQAQSIQHCPRTLKAAQLLLAPVVGPEYSLAPHSLMHPRKPASSPRSRGDCSTYLGCVA
jgi:hypothetical protein